jgi:hypothetical protein
MSEGMEMPTEDFLQTQQYTNSWPKAQHITETVPYSHTHHCNIKTMAGVKVVNCLSPVNLIKIKTCTITYSYMHPKEVSI